MYFPIIRNKKRYGLYVLALTTLLGMFIFLFMFNTYRASSEIIEVKVLDLVSSTEVNLDSIQRVINGLDYIYVEVSTKSRRKVWGKFTVSYKNNIVAEVRIPHIDRETKAVYVFPVDSSLEKFDKKNTLINVVEVYEK